MGSASAEQQVATDFNNFRNSTTAKDQVGQRLLSDAHNVEGFEGNDQEDLQTLTQHLQETGILPGITITNVRDGDGENDTVVTHEDGSTTPDADLEIKVDGHEYGAQIEKWRSHVYEQSARARQCRSDHRRRNRQRAGSNSWS